jgi:hypothetical protein
MGVALPKADLPNLPANPGYSCHAQPSPTLAWACFGRTANGGWFLQRGDDNRGNPEPRTSAGLPLCPDARDYLYARMRGASESVNGDKKSESAPMHATDEALSLLREIRDHLRALRERRE